MPLFNPAVNSAATDPYANDGATAPTSSSASGVYTSATITYPSSIDVAITNLSAKTCYDNGCAAANPATLPILVIMHGYANDYTSFITSDMQRFASYGFFVIAVGLRGNNGASGTRDASAREIYDILDALTYVRANSSSVVSPTKAAIVGYSGGGGNAMACMVKCPDYFNATVAFFALSDYGYVPVTGWYDYGQISLSPTSKSYLDTEVGVRTSAGDPYLARFATPAIPKILALGGFLEMFHDTADTAVNVECSRQVERVILAAGLGATKYKYHESTVGDTTRWLHGHPQDHLTQMTAAEWMFGRRLRETAVWSMPAKGTIQVNGWFKSRGQNFEIWLGSSPNPQTNGSSGRTKVATVEYDIPAGTFKITPITQTGTMYVQIRIGTQVEVLTISDATKSYMVEFYGDNSYALVEIIDASSMPFSDNGTIATIPDASGNGYNYTTSNSPVFKSTGLASGPSIRFNGSNQYAVNSNPVIVFGAVKKFSFAWVGQFSTITGTRAAFIFGLNTQGIGYGCNLNATSKFELEVPASFRDDLAAANTSPHFFLVSWDGTSWYAEIDGVATPVTNVNVTPQVPNTRSVIGAYTNTGTFPFHGDIGMRWVSSKNWNSTQRAAIRAYAKTIWTALP